MHIERNYKVIDAVTNSWSVLVLGIENKAY